MAQAQASRLVTGRLYLQRLSCLAFDARAPVLLTGGMSRQLPAGRHLQTSNAVTNRQTNTGKGNVYLNVQSNFAQTGMLM
jgi:hypothetical protein